MQFQYVPPRPLEDRRVDWLDDDKIEYNTAGYGICWEASPHIMVTGSFSPYTAGDSLGEREYLGKIKDAVYPTPQVDAWVGR